MSLQDRLKGRTAGLGLSPTTPASPGPGDGGIPPAGLVVETDPPTRARTGPGRMFHMQQLAGDKDERIAALEERVKQFDGAMASRAVDPKTVGFSAYANRHEEEFSSPEFQELVEETRRELAHHYLRHSTVELNETAFLLGYEDSNSFFRAFQGWEGTTQYVSS